MSKSHSILLGVPLHEDRGSLGPAAMGRVSLTELCLYLLGSRTLAFYGWDRAVAPYYSLLPSQTKEIKSEMYLFYLTVIEPMPLSHSLILLWDTDLWWTFVSRAVCNSVSRAHTTKVGPSDLSMSMPAVLS